MMGQFGWDEPYLAQYENPNAPNGFGFVRVRQLESLQYQVDVARGGRG